MVLRRLRRQFHFLRGEPLEEVAVAADDGSRGQVVGLASRAESGVVVGGRRIDYVRLDGVVLSELQRLVHHVTHMLPPVGRVERVVHRDDLLLDISAERGGDLHFSHHTVLLFGGANILLSRDNYKALVKLMGSGCGLFGEKPYICGV